MNDQTNQPLKVDVVSDLKINSYDTKSVTIQIPADKLVSLENIARGYDISVGDLINTYVMESMQYDMAKLSANFILDKTAQVLVKRILQNKSLDGRNLFIFYYQDVKQRSIRKVIKFLNENNCINWETKKPFTDMAIWLSMWRWAINNIEEAYEIFKPVMDAEGDKYSKYEWIVFVQRKAIVVFKNNPRLYSEWLDKNNLNDLIGFIKGDE